jgi:thiamine-monophosphate kinase
LQKNTGKPSGADFPLFKGGGRVLATGVFSFMHEFDLIRHYFAKLTPPQDQLILGIGDDAAIWRPSPGKDLILTVDTLHVGRHFLPNCPPSSIAHKALAVNLSDCAAMGASPRGFLLSLSMPEADEPWLRDFCVGLQALANQHKLTLMGGDTTQGPLSISITLIGEVTPGQALCRSGAQVGDDIYVSGSLGLPRLGLEILRKHRYLPEVVYDEIIKAYREPTPQLALGQALVGMASSCIDISDGLIADLGHIVTASHCGARITVENLPIAILLKEYGEPEHVMNWALSGGDDYQLVFTAPADKRAAIEQLSENLNLPLSRIGQITPGTEVICQRADGETVDIARGGWEHFTHE